MPPAPRAAGPGTEAGPRLTPLGEAVVRGYRAIEVEANAAAAPQPAALSRRESG